MYTCYKLYAMPSRFANFPVSKTMNEQVQKGSQNSSFSFKIFFFIFLKTKFVFNFERVNTNLYVKAQVFTSQGMI